MSRCLLFHNWTKWKHVNPITVTTEGSWKVFEPRKYERKCRRCEKLNQKVVV